MSELDCVEIYTDGACRGNPGPGGWAALLRKGSKEREIAGGEPLTTNNRMELVAAIRALEALSRPCRVELHTDSVYVRDGITKWIHKWRQNGWRTSDKKLVKNAELWQSLIEAVSPTASRGAGQGSQRPPDNDRVDALAAPRRTGSELPKRAEKTQRATHPRCSRTRLRRAARGPARLIPSRPAPRTRRKRAR